MIFLKWGRFLFEKGTVPISKNHCFFILGFEIKDAIYPKNTAAAIPPALAFRPPVKIPKKPLCLTAYITPLARLFPKPVKVTVAPHPANLTR